MWSDAMFAAIEADIYVLVDGDATYDPGAAPRLATELLAGPFDMVNGARLHQSAGAHRAGHVWGNKLLSGLVSLIFGAQNRDMLSGYKALSRRFVKSFPATSAGFEIETELLVHALDLDLPISEIETEYHERTPGSLSKLSTIKDGMRVLWMILHLVRDLLPLQFFSAIGSIFMLASIAAGIPIISEYIATGLVPRLPTAVLAVGLMIVGILSLFSGLILDSVAKGRREAKLLAYLSCAQGLFEQGSYDLRVLELRDRPHSSGGCPASVHFGAGGGGAGSWAAWGPRSVLAAPAAQGVGARCDHRLADRTVPPRDRSRKDRVSRDQRGRLAPCIWKGSCRTPGLREQVGRNAYIVALAAFGPRQRALKFGCVIEHLRGGQRAARGFALEANLLHPVSAPRPFHRMRSSRTGKAARRPFL